MAPKNYFYFSFPRK